MPHFFIKSENVSNNIVQISDTENYKHIAKALRAKVGEKLLLIDENQIQYETVIKDITSKEIIAEIKDKYKSKRFLDFELYLAQSPLRSEAQSVIIEKATELGVTGVYPIFTDNCALKKDVISKKIDKWQKTMYEASKQCERAVVPTCFEMTTMDELLKNNKFDIVIAFCERLSELTFRDYLKSNLELFNNKKVLVIIGPEGGFSEREFKFFKDNNIPMLTLGDLILKAETAVIVAIGNIIYEYNNSKSN